MRSLSFIPLSLLLVLLPFSYADNTAKRVLVDDPAPAFILVRHGGAPTTHSHPRSSADPATHPSKTTLITSTSKPSRATPTSVVQATRQESGYSGAASAAPSNAVDTVGGASGTDSSSFSLSKGGLIAIIVVIVVVALFGIASIVLYVLAKKRQWNVRSSIARASRRLTGRPDKSDRREEEDRRKRSGIIAGSKPGPTTTHQPGHKRGIVVEVKDEEKGPLDYGTPPKTKKPRENTWIQRLWGNDWK